MSKYWHVIRIGVQSTLVYRFNFLARAAFALVPLMATLYIWRTIFEGRDSTVSGYSLGKMVTYYLITLLVDTLTAVTDDDWQVAADIKDGNISQFLLKPMDYLWFRFCLFLSGRMTYLTVAFLPIALVIFYLREQFLLPPDFATLAAFSVSVAMTALLQFFLSYTMAMLAFWLMEISTFVFILYAFEYIASGHMFPLDVLPDLVKSLLLNFTPFPYQLYLPVGIYLGKITGSQLITGMAIQAGWVVVAYFLARFAWYRGIKKYAAAGG